MRRTLFEQEHEDFRQLCRTFFEKECVPHTQEWEKRGNVGRELWKKAGDAGLLLWEAPEEFGGAGIKDYRYSYVFTEEFHAAGVAGFGAALQNDVMAPYFFDLMTREQMQRFIPKSVAGEYIWSIAISEPGAGSDVAGVRTTAVRDGDEYVINGSKTFITNGLLSTHVLVVAKTDPSAGRKGVSLFVVEDGMPGFSRGRQLEKVGQHSQDTAELFFSDVRVPAANLVGEENRGFYALMRNLAQERVGVATSAVGTMRRALNVTVDYVRQRPMFGSTLGALQNTRFELAAVKTLLDAATAYTDTAVANLVAGTLTPDDAASLKLWTSEAQWEVVDRCLQLFGGYGYTTGYEINRLWRDSRVQRIYAGSNEVMKEIVGRSLKLDAAP